MATLAHASSSLVSRLGALEREMESQRLRTAGSLSCHLNRVEIVEMHLKELLVRRVVPAPEQALRYVDGLERPCLLVEELQLQLNAGWVDAAATRAAVSWPGVTKDLLRASVSTALDEATPQFLAEVTAVVLRDLPNSVSKDNMALQCQQLTRDILETKDLTLNAVAAVSRLDVDVNSRPSREEMLSIAEAVACRHCSLLKSFVISDRSKLNASLSLAESDQDFSFAGGCESSDPANVVMFDSFERRCDMIEKRCDEVVCILNRKAYKSDVTRALISLEKMMQRVYRGSYHQCKLLHLTLIYGFYTLRISIRFFYHVGYDASEHCLQNAASIGKDYLTRLIALESAQREDPIDMSIVTGRILALEKQVSGMQIEILAFCPNTDKHAPQHGLLRQEVIDVVVKAAGASWHAAIADAVRNVDHMRREQRILELKVASLESSIRKHESGFYERLTHLKSRLDKFISMKTPMPDKSIAASHCEHQTLPIIDISEKTADRLKHVARVAAQEVLTTTQSWRDGVVISLQKLEGRVLACEPRIRRARWLWRSGDTSQGGWIPWEFEALNSSPQLFEWRPTEASYITTTHAGLYHVSVGIFTHNHATIQLCIQGETILTLEPRSQRGVVDDTITMMNPDTTNNEESEQGVNQRGTYALYESYALRRSQHSAGQITCLAIDEFLALPASCNIAIRFDSSFELKDTARQAFLAITKV